MSQQGVQRLSWGNPPVSKLCTPQVSSREMALSSSWEEGLVHPLGVLTTAAPPPHPVAQAGECQVPSSPNVPQGFGTAAWGHWAHKGTLSALGQLLGRRKPLNKAVGELIKQH